MTTLSEILNKLKKEGSTEDFNRKENGREGFGNLIQVHPEEFVVDRHYRFEGNSNPDDEAVVYAISSRKFQVKGTLVNGYGISSDTATDALLNTLKAKIMWPANGAARPLPNHYLTCTCHEPGY